jgi:hypothetical protein
MSAEHAPRPEERKSNSIRSSWRPVMLTSTGPEPVAVVGTDDRRVRVRRIHLERLEGVARHDGPRAGRGLRGAVPGTAAEHEDGDRQPNSAHHLQKPPGGAGRLRTIPDQVRSSGLNTMT